MSVYDFDTGVRGECQTSHMVHSHTVHLPLGALLSTCTMCGTGEYTETLTMRNYTFFQTPLLPASGDEVPATIKVEQVGAVLLPPPFSTEGNSPPLTLLALLPPFFFSTGVHLPPFFFPTGVHLPPSFPTGVHLLRRDRLRLGRTGRDGHVHLDGARVLRRQPDQPHQPHRLPGEPRRAVLLPPNYIPW